MKRHLIVSLLSTFLFSLTLTGQPVLLTDTAYHLLNGKVKSIVKYAVIGNDTIMEDSATFYYATGDLWQKGSYKKGNMNGKWTTWYTDGNIKRTSQFEDGMKNGEIINYYDNGNPKLILYYQKDTVVGLATLYYDNGQIKETRYYKDNKLTELQLVTVLMELLTIALTLPTVFKVDYMRNTIHRVS